LQQTTLFQIQMRIRLAHATLSLSGLLHLDFERGFLKTTGQTKQ